MAVAFPPNTLPRARREELWKKRSIFFVVPVLADFWVKHSKGVAPQRPGECCDVLAIQVVCNERLLRHVLVKPHSRHSVGNAAYRCYQQVHFFFCEVSLWHKDIVSAKPPQRALTNADHCVPQPLKDFSLCSILEYLSLRGVESHSIVFNYHAKPWKHYVRFKPAESGTRVNATKQLPQLTKNSDLWPRTLIGARGTTCALASALYHRCSPYMLSKSWALPPNSFPAPKDNVGRRHIAVASCMPLRGYGGKHYCERVLIAQLLI